MCCWLLQQLADIKGLSDTKIEKMVEAAKKCVSGYGWQTAAYVEKQVSSAHLLDTLDLVPSMYDYDISCNTVQRAREIVKINFGAQQVNELLGGGLETKAITEMFGEYRYARACSIFGIARMSQTTIVRGLRPL